MKVCEFLKVKKAVGDVGIEIEAEGKNLPLLDGEVWRSEDDGSLRGMFPGSRNEFVLRRPIPITAVKDALTELKESIAENGGKLDFSYRCSVHVHVNVQQLTMCQLLAMIYAYYLLEEPLMTYCGKGRKGNNFCLRLQDAEGVLEGISPLFENGMNGIRLLQGEGYRYAAMNVEALRKYGSLEFRGMEGNLDVERINTWSKTLVALREYAAAKGNPKAVYEDFTRLSANGFFNEVLGENAKKFHYSRAYREMETSFSLSIDLPFSYRVPQAVTAKVDIEYWEYELGAEVNKATAVKIVENGGNVKVRAVGVYMVSKQAKKPKPDQWAEWNRPIMGMEARAIIMDDFAPFAGPAPVDEGF